MAAQYNVHEAKTRLSALLERVEAGEEITIARAGRPVARLVPWRPEQRPRRLGLFAGQIHLAEDFDQLPADLVSALEGGGDGGSGG